MKYIPKDTKGWTKPSSVVASQVEKETYPAKLPSANTPNNMIVTEYFIRGTQPTEVSERYANLNEIENPQINVNGNVANITWTYTTPKVLTDEYLNKYFNQSTFGKSKEELIKKRKKYNSETLGEIVFGIYKEKQDGTLLLIEYTNNMNYTYVGNESTTLVIKAEHAIYKTNASNGTKLNINITSSGNTSTTKKLKATLNGKVDTDAVVGNYTESGIKTILYGTTNITNSTAVSIKYQIINNNNITDYTSIKALETAIIKPKIKAGFEIVQKHNSKP